MSDKMREAFKVAFRKAASEDVDYDEAVDRGLAAALTAQAEQHGGVSGWYCAHCQHGVDPVDVTFGEKHVYCGYPVTDCPAPPAPVAPDGWRDALIAALAAWACADEFVAANFNKLGDAIIKYPVLQGTGNQIRARRIAREPYDGKKAAAALSEIAAMLAAAPEVKP